jgi:ribosomal peptide maturation radical SAM protein 1
VENRQSQESVLLVSMPWTSLAEPCLGLALLRGVMDEQGIPCRVLHANLFLLEHLSGHTYQALAHIYVLNDFVFSGVLDPTVTNAQERALRLKAREIVNPRGGLDPLRFGGSEGVIQTIFKLRNEIIPKWLEQWADEIASSDATLIGFTCMFDQTIASLALAKMIKARAPEKMIALGGYAVRSPTAEMLLRSNPWIDAVCVGEGEITLQDLAHASVGKISLSAVRGIVYRDAEGVVQETVPPPEADLDKNPPPNFDDFFADCKRLSDDHKIDIEVMDIPMENSRGCWWGSKGHCTFCGIKDADMAYRYRSAARTIEVMEEHHQRYKMNAFRFSDYILPNQYYATLLPMLIERGSPYELCAEMKSNVNREQFALLAKAGFKEVQPGIESFHSDVLKKMSKGVSAAQNVFTLLLGRRYGIRIFYNIIYGFPHDIESEYEFITKMLPRLAHLDAPVTCVPVQITRWAPLAMDPDRFGIPPGPPEAHYDMLFSASYLQESGFKIEDFCYYFERTFDHSIRLHQWYDRIVDFVTDWRAKNTQQTAWLHQEGSGVADGMIIRDHRADGDEIIHELGPALAALLDFAQEPVTIAKLQASGVGDPDRIPYMIEQLDEMGLIFRDGNRIISLVLPDPKLAGEHPWWAVKPSEPAYEELLPILA